jgi:hypothetical protein
MKNFVFLAGVIAAIAINPVRGSASFEDENSKSGKKASAKACYHTPDAGSMNGGEVPYPFSGLNQKAELAHAEDYTLIGSVEKFGERFYFRVDLKKHPWLANSLRSADPRYPLLAGPFYWHDYMDITVQLFVRAEAKIVHIGGRSHYVISLRPLAHPIILSIPQKSGESEPIESSEKD